MEKTHLVASSSSFDDADGDCQSMRAQRALERKKVKQSTYVPFV